MAIWHISNQEKKRVKAMPKYKKPVFWMILISVVLCAVIAVYFLTRPKEQNADLSPDYASTDTTHTDVFLDILKHDGYCDGEEQNKSYNTDGISGVVNITPKSISDETEDIEVFLIKDAEHCFLMADGVLYRYETFGGYHEKLCLWDYDGNGTKDLVSCDSFGSGISYLGVSIFDMTKKEPISVFTRNLLSEKEFSFEFENGVVYIDGEELKYENNEFLCKAFR